MRICILFAWLFYATALTAQNNIAQFTFNFEEGESSLKKDPELQLGMNINSLYISPLIHVIVFYNPLGNVAVNEDLALERLDQIKKFLQEERINMEKVQLDAFPQNSDVDVLIEYELRRAATNQPINVDSVIIHPDGYRLQLNTNDFPLISQIHIQSLQINDSLTQSEVNTMSSDGDALACVGMYTITTEGHTISDTAFIMLPISDDFSMGKLTVYQQNKYTKAWNKVTGPVSQKKISGKKFMSVPFTEASTFSLQYNLEKKGITVNLHIPSGMAVRSGTIQTRYPDTHQPGEISADQTEISFRLPKDFEFESITLDVVDLNMSSIDLNKIEFEKEFNKKLKSLDKGSILDILLKTDLFTLPELTIHK